MKITKTVEVPATTKEVADLYRCDLCGCGTKNNSCWPTTLKPKESPRWSLGIDKNVREVTIKMRIGDTYPEGSWGETTTFDICTDCFQTVLIPWLKTKGAEPRIEEWDW